MPARLGKCTFSKTSSCCAETGVGFMLIDAALFLLSQFEGCKFCILAKLYIQGYCNCVPFDKKLALTMIDSKMYINSFFKFFSYFKFIGKGEAFMASSLILFILFNHLTFLVKCQKLERTRLTGDHEEIALSTVGGDESGCKLACQLDI